MSLGVVGEPLEQDKWSPHDSEAYYAEIFGAKDLLQAYILAKRRGELIGMLLDLQAAINAVHTGRTFPSMEWVWAFLEARKSNAKIRQVPDH